MKIVYAIISLILISGCSARVADNKGELAQRFSHAERQTRLMVKEANRVLEKSRTENRDSLPVAPRTLNDSMLVMVPSRDWTSGFFSGVLWYLYQYTGDEEWKKQARVFSAMLEQEQRNAKTHDMGFKMYCSFGNGYRLTNDERYKDILIQSAKTLSTRFRPTAGVIRSWDHNRDKWHFPVIIDNMMNLELLFFATKATGDSSFYHIARTHAETTLRNHFRADYSSYHVVDYDTLTGKVLKRNTHQGYAHESAWSRGQAWGLYGYTMCYRETGDSSFLAHAEGIAAFILGHVNLPTDLIPYWDFNAPEIPNEERDASAAAVMASALYELSTYSRNGVYYRKQADSIIHSLAAHYASPEGTNKGFILQHSTGSKPAASEVDVPLCYADYYYLEALLRKQALETGGRVLF